MSDQLQERKLISLSKVNLKWFADKYGDASLSWICDLLLTKFREHNTMTPDKYAEIAAKELGGELDEL